MSAVSLNFSSPRSTTAACATLLALLVLSGCATTGEHYVSCGPTNCDNACGPGRRTDTCDTDRYGTPQNAIPGGISAFDNVPHALRNSSRPEYRVERPVAVLTEATPDNWPSSERVHPGESLVVQLNSEIPTRRMQPAMSQQFRQINGIYVIGADGYLNLGPAYGKVHVAEQSLDEIQKRLDTHLRHILRDAQVLVTVTNSQDALPTSDGQSGFHRPRFLEPTNGPRLSRRSHEISRQNGRLSRFRTASGRSTYQPRPPSRVASHTVEGSPNQTIREATPSATYERSLRIPHEPSSGRAPIMAPQPRKSRSETNSNSDNLRLPTALDFASHATRFQY